MQFVIYKQVAVAARYNKTLGTVQKSV